jgi:hypothetical protein
MPVDTADLLAALCTSAVVGAFWIRHGLKWSGSRKVRPSRDAAVPEDEPHSYEQARKNAGVDDEERQHGTAAPIFAGLCPS